MRFHIELDFKPNYISRVSDRLIIKFYKLLKDQKKLTLGFHNWGHEFESGVVAKISFVIFLLL